MDKPKLIAHLVERSTGEVVQEFDLTGFWPRKIDRWFDGLLYQVDFERYYIAEDLAELRSAAETGELDVSRRTEQPKDTPR